MFVKKLSKNKYLAITFSKSKNCFRTWFYLNISFSTAGDHAGFNFCIGVGNRYFEIEITDNRHWDYEKDEFKEGY